MTPRERVQAAFRFEQPDRPPYTFWIDDEPAARLAEYYGDPDWQRHWTCHILRLTADWEPRTEIGPNRYIDAHGTEWEMGAIMHIARPALGTASMQGVVLPDYTATLGDVLPPIRAQLEAANPTQYTCVGFGFGVFERAWMMRGYENFFVDLVESPAFCHELLDAVLERQLALVDELVKLPIDGVMFSDDFGDQRGVIIGPRLWREFIKPRVAALYERAHAAGKMTLQHTCGNVFDIVPDLIECGLDVLQSLQPEAMDIYEIKRRWGDRLRFWGGLGTQQLLPLGTPEQVRAEVRRLCAEMGRGGGYVFNSAKPVRPDVPTANAVAMFETLLELHGETPPRPAR